MGILKLFSKPRPAVQKLPHGSLTVDRNAQIVASTISSAVEPELLQDLGQHILGLFREARKAQMSLTELNLHFAGLLITAREMRGGAVIFLKPKDLFKSPSQN
jgi:hypothetical protein